VAAEKVEIVYEGVEVPPPVSPEARRSARQRWGVSEEETLFGCVGYLLPEKGQKLIVRALASVRANFPSTRLLLAGDGPCRPQLEALARELGLENSVIFAGFIEDVSQVYAALDAFVFPSLAEPLGTSLLAAMAWGLPVIAVASGGVPEYVENGVLGLLVTHPDLRLFLVEALRLLSNHELTKRLGAAARDAIQNRFTADHMVENTLRVYEDVLK
jgi:glycosyltransferase involved in cell wall biosynthesis